MLRERDVNCKFKIYEKTHASMRLLNLRKKACINASTVQNHKEINRRIKISTVQNSDKKIVVKFGCLGELGSGDLITPLALGSVPDLSGPAHTPSPHQHRSSPTHPLNYLHRLPPTHPPTHPDRLPSTTHHSLTNPSS